MIASLRPTLLFPVTRTSTEANRTGSWRFVRPVYRFKTAPCSAACPAGIDIPTVEMLASRGQVHDAWAQICRENPLPSVCGRVCFHPCEDACNRAELDAPIAINALERYIGDAGLTARSPLALPTAPALGRKVAIVGAGPAGLAAGYFLTRLGIAAEIFERSAEPGGVLRWGIPSYRLPKRVLAAEIDRIAAAGVAIHCNRPVNPDTLAEMAARCDAVLVGAGLAATLRLNISGEGAVIDGLSFLEQVQTGSAPAVGGEVAVIGGGNTAIDVARTLLRQGARPTIVYRRRRQDMPAFGHEIAAAESEGVKIVELMAPVSAAADGDGVRLTLQPMRAAEVGTDGRVRAVPAKQPPREMRFNGVFSGIGAEVAEPWHRPADEADTIRLSHCAICRGPHTVGHIGDPVTAENSVAHAIGSGKQAAIALHALFTEGPEAVAPAVDRCRVGSGPALSLEIYLNGERNRRNGRVVTFADINTDYFPRAERCAIPALAPAAAASGFQEAVVTLDPREALAEATRCFNCGICNDCDNCRIFCPEQTIRVGEGGRSVDLDYCKGCGICTVECPRCAMDMEEESA
ncbi:MAG: FAD-dependent oxidoreductase [Desulfobacteraceae bacterium]|jgi:NADPH-dependent glutamate synthase beta subunit-like oxidoreductase|nr:FAD-dependent oxidoreductase [Desulfobacteraceae bacterium]